MSTQQSGLVAGNSQNKAGGSTGRSRSKFPLSYSQFQTERFAEYTPFFVEEGVSGDVLPLHSNHEVQTYTLKSPILQSLSKKKDYFVVPMQAILPLNWEKFYTNPNIGQDVPSDCGLGVVGFWQKMKALFSASWAYLLSSINGTSDSDAVKTQNLLKFLLFFENIYSAGSLMETLRISGHNWFRATYSQGQNLPTIEVGFDFLFDKLIGIVNTHLTGSSNNVITFSIGSQSYRIVGTPIRETNGVADVSLREALELMRDDLTFVVSSSTLTNNSLSPELGKYTLYLPDSDADLNLGRLWAYQLVVSHFYSNDHVDFIYSAELFRQYIQELVTRQTTATDNPSVIGQFTVNGLSYNYDALSAYSFNTVINSFSANGIYGFTTSTTVVRPLKRK